MTTAEKTRRAKMEAARDSAMLQTLFYWKLRDAAALRGTFADGKKADKASRDWRVFDAAGASAAKEALRLARQLNGGTVPQ